MVEASTRLLHLLQLVSPTLPTGGFAYSQGLEWAVETGWVRDGESLQRWTGELLDHSLARVDVPLLARMHACCSRNDQQGMAELADLVLACRESSELRQEERNRGRALSQLLTSLELPGIEAWQEILSTSQLAAFAFAAERWAIPIPEAVSGYLWAWLENQVLAGVKIIPLGQTAGQRILLHLLARIPEAAQSGLELREEEIGSTSQGLALACSLHETQYTRLYRS